jgi:hypothetical protein
VSLFDDYKLIGEILKDEPPAPHPYQAAVDYLNRRNAMSNQPEFLQEVLEPALQKEHKKVEYIGDPESVDGSFVKVVHACAGCPTCDAKKD